MAKKEKFLGSEDIETMKKDIDSLEGKEGKTPSASYFLEEEEKIKEDKEKTKRKLWKEKIGGVIRKKTKPEEERDLEIETLRKEEEKIRRLKELKKKEEETAEMRRSEEEVSLEEEADLEEAKLEEEKKAREEEIKRREEEIKKKEKEMKLREEKRWELEESRRRERRKEMEEELKKKEEELKKKEEDRRRREKIRVEAELMRKEEEIKRKRMELEEEIKRREEEIRRKEEARKKRAEPEYKKNLLLGEKRKIDKEKEKINNALKRLNLEKKPLEDSREKLFKEIENIQKMSVAVLKKEEEAERQKEEIERKEASAKTPEEKKQIEKERWKLEEKRRELEKRRWPWDEKMKKADKKSQEVDLKYAELKIKEEDIKRQQEEIFKREKDIRLKIEKIDLGESFEEIKKSRSYLETEKSDLSENLNEIQEKLDAVLAEEEKIEEEGKLIEEEEKLTKDLEERRSLEKERWELEEKRRKIESEKWELEDKKHKAELQLKRKETGIQRLLEKADNINKRIAEIDQLLSLKKIITEKKPKFKPKKPLLFKKAAGIDKEIEKEKVKLGEEIKRREESIRLEEEELRREKKEVETREEEKRIKNGEIERRERESLERRREEQRKREKIEEQKRADGHKEEVEKALAEAEKRREDLLKKIGSSAGRSKRDAVLPSSLRQKPKMPIKSLPPRPSLKDKFWVRILFFSIILVVLAGVSTFWYWYLVIRTQPPPSLIECATNEDCPVGQACGPGGTCISIEPITECVTDNDCTADRACNLGVCVEREELIEVPASLFSIEETRTLAISSLTEVRALLLQTLQEWQDEDTFKRVVIKDMKENRVLGLKELFNALQVRIPEEIYDKIGNNFTLFIYSQVDGNRLGFVAETAKKGELESLLFSMEITIKDDFNPFLSLMEVGELASVTYFRNSSQIAGYVGPNFRYQTIAQNDLGACYLVSNEHFIFATSWKSMTRVIERLAVKVPTVELTEELKYGDQGESVKLLQLWLAEDQTVYPQNIVSGWFGRLTEAAVIRFQEKYASEILAPQGLYRGTGVVDLYTRIKLNELYGASGIIPKAVELITGLKYGDHGDEVRLLQTWLAKDSDVYPKGITSGWFGPLTRTAVVRFQEKYASEILIPQGLSDGTGIVDALTRQKLNQLYGGK